MDGFALQGDTGMKMPNARFVEIDSVLQPIDNGEGWNADVAELGRKSFCGAFGDGFLQGPEPEEDIGKFLLRAALQKMPFIAREQMPGQLVPWDLVAGLDIDTDFSSPGNGNRDKAGRVGKVETRDRAAWGEDVGLAMGGGAETPGFFGAGAVVDGCKDASQGSSAHHEAVINIGSNSSFRSYCFGRIQVVEEVLFNDPGLRHGEQKDQNTR